jgi:RNA-splicing ligase RtcB
MKVSYLGYVKLMKEVPAFIHKYGYMKVIPGDTFEVPNDFIEEAKRILTKNFIIVKSEKEVEVPKEDVCEDCGRIVSQCKCEKLAAKAQREEDLKQGQKKEDEKKQEIAQISEEASNLVSYKLDLQKQGLSKQEVKAKIAEYKKENNLK